ncbi:MAG: VOC family protein [Phormidesmis sp.]
MYFHHLHFYIEDAAVWKDWFEGMLAFSPAAIDRSETVHSEIPSEIPSENHDENHDAIALVQDGIEIRLSTPKHSHQVRRYLTQHPPGLADIAFASDQFDAVLAHALRQGARLLEPVILLDNGQRQCQLNGWADLRHTLVEVSADWIKTHQPSDCPAYSRKRQLSQETKETLEATSSEATSSLLSFIDHVVINVPQGELQAAVAWYQSVFDLQLGQSFEINTAHSGLCSQVLLHPEGTLQLPINEPSSANSQVQEFLNHNRGAGVQHVALRSADAVSAIAYFRQQGLKLLNVPKTYYENLPKRANCPLKDLSTISQQQLLLDWNRDGKKGMLLQTFTEPIFAEPTFFFEIIERSYYSESGQFKLAKGFGEGNFQALFEAIERAQLERGSLKP